MSFNNFTRVVIDNSKSAADHELSISLGQIMATISAVIPTVDPAVAGEWWNDGGVITISAGP